jgi:hypothetical protein
MSNKIRQNILIEANKISTRKFSSNKRLLETNYHFDTFKLVERLEKEKFTREQSEAIMISLRKVIGESMSELSRPIVKKSEQEKVTFMPLSIYIKYVCIGDLYVQSRFRTVEV